MHLIRFSNRLACQSTTVKHRIHSANSHIEFDNKAKTPPHTTKNKTKVFKYVYNQKEEEKPTTATITPHFER